MDAAVTVTLREWFPLEGGCLFSVSLPLASCTTSSLALVKRQAQFPDSKLWKILFFFSTVASGHLVFWQGTQDDLKMVSFLPQILFFPSNT